MRWYVWICVLLSMVFLVFCLSPAMSVKGDTFSEQVNAVGYGCIENLNPYNHSVNYNGSELILFVNVLYNNTVGYTAVEGNITAVELYNSVNTKSNNINTTVYMYRVIFVEDGYSCLRFYFSDGSSGRVLFNVTGAGYVYIDGDELYKLREEWNYGVSEKDDIEELMGAVYDDTPKGHHDAVSDTIDDSRAIRKGPVLFGQNMLFGILIMFSSPFTFIWLLVIVAIFMSVRKKESEVLRKIDDDREGMDIDTEELAVAAGVAKSRSMGLFASIRSIAPYIGISTVVWRDIHRRFATVASLLSAFDDTTFFDDGRAEGPIVDALSTWVRNSLTLEQRSKAHGLYRAPTMVDYVDSLKRILQYVSTYLHYNNYEIYIRRLDESSEWLLDMVKDLKPGGVTTDMSEGKSALGVPDFSGVMDTLE